MNYRKLLTCLLAAVGTVTLYFLYTKWFGAENGLLGLITGISVYVLLNVDFTSDIKYNAVTLLGLNLFLGAIAYFSGISLFGGIFINIITIFIVCFIYTSKSQNVVSFIFLLLYVIMWSNPVELALLPNRLLAVTTGVVVIILSQIIFNRNKFKKSSKSLIIDAINNIRDEIRDIKEDKYLAYESVVIDNKLRSLLLSIDSRNKRKNYKDINDRTYFNIVVVLERLNIIINQVAILQGVDKAIKEDYLDGISIQLELIINFIEGNSGINIVSESTDKFIDKYRASAKKHTFIYESIEAMKILKLNLNNINSNDTIIGDIIGRKNVEGKSWNLNFKRAIFDVNTVRFTYSLRLAVAIALAMFVVDYFNIVYGSWMVVTIFVVLQPYTEDTVVKARNRFKGTIIGVFASTIIFYIAPTVVTSIPFLIFILCMYYYASAYYKQVIWASALLISMTAATKGVEVVSFSRVVFVIVGILIALVFNKRFLPFSLENSVESLRHRYIEILWQMFQEVKKLNEGKDEQNIISMLALESNLIESNLIKNISILNDNNLEEWVYRQGIILSDIRFLILEIYYGKDKEYVKDRELSEEIILAMMSKIENEIDKNCLT